MDGKWINLPEEDTVVIWIHGILSSQQVCWENENKTFWPEMVSDDKSITGVGNYVFTYHTSVFSSDYSISDIVDSLKEFIKLDGLLKYKKIVFVCHSMGGIIARKYLVDRAADLRAKIVGLFLLASPSLGSNYADFFSPLARFLGHSQASVLLLIENNGWLMELNRNFRNLKEGSSLKILGKELVEDKFIVLPYLGLFNQVVTPVSGSQFFGDPIKIAKTDHFSIAKPKDSIQLQHRLLVQFIGEVAGLKSIQSQEGGVNSNSKSVGSFSQELKLDLDKADSISIKEYQRINKLSNKNSIGHAAIHPDGNQIAYCQDQSLFTMPLSEALGQFVGNHDEKITDIIYTRKGDLLISSDIHGRIKVWDSKSKELVNDFQAHRDAISRLDVSRDNKYLASGSLDEKVKVWSIDELVKISIKCVIQFDKKSDLKKSRRRKGPHNHEIEHYYSIAFSPDNKYLASGDYNGVLVIRELTTKVEVFRKNVHNHSIEDIAFSPVSNDLLATASDDKRIRLIDLRFGGRVTTLGTGGDKHKSGVNSVAFSYKGDILISSGSDSLIKIWNVKNRSLIKEHVRKEEELINKVRFFPNKYNFTTNAFEKNISLWQIKGDGSVNETKIT